MCMGLQISDRQYAKNTTELCLISIIVHPQFILTSTDAIQSSETAAIRIPTQELDLPGLAQLEDVEEKLHFLFSENAPQLQVLQPSTNPVQMISNSRENQVH